MELLQELNNCLIDKSELVTLFVGGDWNCTLSKNDTFGDKPWKATDYRNLVLTTMDILYLISWTFKESDNQNSASAFMNKRL